MTGLRKRRLFCVLLTLLTAVYIGFIYGNSLQDGAASSERSGRVVEMLQALLSSLGWQGTVSDYFIRKAAHFAEYAGLGLLLGLTLRAYTPHILRHVFVPLFIGLLVPVSDEFLQLFIEGRAGMVQDVVLDFAGFLAGGGITIACILLVQYFRKRAADRAGNVPAVEGNGV